MAANFESTSDDTDDDTLTDEKDERKSSKSSSAEKKEAVKLGSFVVEGNQPEQSSLLKTPEKPESFWQRLVSREQKSVPPPPEAPAEEKLEDLDVTPELDGEAPLLHLTEVETMAVNQNLSRVRAEEIASELETADPDSPEAAAAEAAKQFHDLVAENGNPEADERAVLEQYLEPDQVNAVLAEVAASGPLLEEEEIEPKDASDQAEEEQIDVSEPNEGEIPIGRQEVSAIVSESPEVAEPDTTQTAQPVSPLAQPPQRTTTPAHTAPPPPLAHPGTPPPPPLPPAAPPSSSGGGGFNLPPPSLSPSFNAVPSTPNRAPNSNADVISTDDAYYNERQALNRGLLVGGIVGYLIGRRRGRIKAERKFRPVQKKLESEVKDLQSRLVASEETIRRAVRTQPVERRAERPIEPARVRSEKADRVAAPPDRRVATSPSLAEQMRTVLVSAPPEAVSAAKTPVTSAERANPLSLQPFENPPVESALPQPVPLESSPPPAPVEQEIIPAIFAAVAETPPLESIVPAKIEDVSARPESWQHPTPSVENVSAAPEQAEPVASARTTAQAESAPAPLTAVPRENIQANMLHLPKIPMERIGQVLVNAEAVETTMLPTQTEAVAAAAPTSPRSETVSLPPPISEIAAKPGANPETALPGRVEAAQSQPDPEAMSRNELLELSATIVIDGASLRQVYETHLVSERGLRRLVGEYLNHGDVKRALRQELIEREIDFERDPILRDRVRTSVSQGAAKGALTALLQEAGASQILEPTGPKPSIHPDAMKADTPSSKKRDIADLGLVVVIILLLLLIILFTVLHH